MADEPESTTTEQQQSESGEQAEKPKEDEPLREPGKKALEAERRARAAAEDEVKALKARLDQFEKETLSKEELAEREAEDAKNAAAEAKSAAEAAKAEALKWRIAAKYGIDEDDADLFLTGSDEETLTRQAERLRERTPANGKGGAPIPGVGERPGKTPTAAEQIRAAEEKGDWASAIALKSQQLMELAREQK